MTIENKNEYQWNEGFSSSIIKTDINAVIAELKPLQDEHGEITPGKVVEAAKNKKSVLHNYFVWDNKEAANRYRLSQASELLRRIEIKIIKDGEPRTLRAFEITTRPHIGVESTFVHTAFDSNRAREISLNDINRVISRLSAFEEFNGVIPVLELVAQNLSRNSTETEKETEVLQTAV